MKDPFDPSLIAGLPDEVLARIKMQPSGKAAVVYDSDGNPIGWANGYTDALRLMVGTDSPQVVHDTNELILLTVQAMENKLYRSELKRRFGSDWKREDWQENLKVDLVHHVMKGDPIDVLNYCAFANYHGWDIAPAQSGGMPISMMPVMDQFIDIQNALKQYVPVITDAIEFVSVSENCGPQGLGLLCLLQDAEAKFKTLQKPLDLVFITSSPVEEVSVEA